MADEGGRLIGRTSVRLFLAAAVVAAVAVASVVYLKRVERDFSPPTTITMGTVVENGAFLGKSSRSRSEWFCWVSYEFTAADGVARRNWRLWEPACGVSPGRPIPIQHVIANPDINRPGGSTPWFPSSLMFFAAGVTVVIGVIVRRAEGSGQGSGGIDL